MIESRCPACGRVAVLPDTDAGRTYTCDCGNVNVAPATARAPEPAPKPSAAVAAGPPVPTEPAVVYEGRPSQWANIWVFLGLLPMVVIPLWLLSGSSTGLKIAVVIIVCYGGWAAFRALRLRCMKYVVTLDNVTVEEGIVTRTVDNIDLFRLNDVNMKQNAWQRMVGTGDVELISTDRSLPTVVLRNLRAPRNVFERVRRAAAAADTRRGVVQVEH